VFRQKGQFKNPNRPKGVKFLSQRGKVWGKGGGVKKETWPRLGTEGGGGFLEQKHRKLSRLPNGFKTRAGPVRKYTAGPRGLQKESQPQQGGGGGTEKDKVLLEKSKRPPRAGYCVWGLSRIEVVSRWREMVPVVS